MFGIDFYPTPLQVIERMLAGVDLTNKVVLEPSAGSGCIVDYCKKAGAKEVLACEIDNDLQKLLSGKCRVIESDFLSVTDEMISHIDFIIMNPPFSSQEEHIRHAWEIGPAGCQIISLFNNSLITNNWTKNRAEINELIRLYGHTQNFGDCFSGAERKTGIDVGCLWIYKEGPGDNEFDGYFDLLDDEQNQINDSGIVRYDFVQDIVSRYVQSVKMFELVDSQNKQMNELIRTIVPNFYIHFGATTSRNSVQSAIDRATFKKELQKAAWKKLFDLFGMEKYVTSGVLKQINKFVEQQENVPFTVKNIYLMIQMIVGTHGERMDNVLVEAFDKICSLSYENSTAGEGWRTNTDFLINKRFIFPCITREGWNGEMCLQYGFTSTMIDDIVKALCYLTAENYNNIKRFEVWVSDFNNSKNGGLKLQFGQWYEWSFFRFKGFKKGTMHFEFIDDDLWLKFNQRVAEIKGWNNVIVHSKKGREKRK